MLGYLVAVFLELRVSKKMFSSLKKCPRTIFIWTLSVIGITVEPLSTDTRILRTVAFVPTKSSYIFSKINPLNTDIGSYGQRTLLCLPSDKFSYIVNPASRTLFICLLSIFNFSKGLANIQFHLAKSQTKSVRTKKSVACVSSVSYSCIRWVSYACVKACHPAIQIL